MSEEKTRGDSLREYHTGAVADGAEQADQTLSLGGYRSSYQPQSNNVVIVNPITNVTVDFVATSEGVATLLVPYYNMLQFKCPGGAGYGPLVDVVGTNPFIVESDDPSQFIRVTSPLEETIEYDQAATLTLTRRVNNVYGMSNVTAADAYAGLITYRALIIKNESAAAVNNVTRIIDRPATATATSNTAVLGATGAGTVETTGSLATWPTSGWCRIMNGSAEREIVYYYTRTDTVLYIRASGRACLGTSAAAGAVTDTLEAVAGYMVGVDAAGVVAAGTAIQTIADEKTAPVGVTFYTAPASAPVALATQLMPGEQVGIWFKREIPEMANTIPLAGMQSTLNFETI